MANENVKYHRRVNSDSGPSTINMATQRDQKEERAIIIDLMSSMAINDALLAAVVDIDSACQANDAWHARVVKFIKSMTAISPRFSESLILRMLADAITVVQRCRESNLGLWLFDGDGCLVPNHYELQEAFTYMHETARNALMRAHIDSETHKLEFESVDILTMHASYRYLKNALDSVRIDLRLLEKKKSDENIILTN
jgi:hypothetical protein